MNYLGLSEKEVLEKRKIFGINSFQEKEKLNTPSLFFNQFKNPLALILFGVGVISLFVQEIFDFFLIISVLLLNSIIGFFQEYNAKKALAALKKVLKPQAMVIRDGQRKMLNIEEIVPDDLVILIAGDKVPADGKLIQGEILVSEAILTGEEEAIKKNPQSDPTLFMGSTVPAGKGIMKVTKIGRETEIGKIGKALVEISEEKTPLQLKLEELSRKLALIIISLSIFIFLGGVMRGKQILSTFKTAIVLAIAAIPEALPVAITVILALGMRKILKKKGLVRSLLAVETLGSTNLICTDKTGTLTEGKMRVTENFFFEKEKTLYNCILNNEQKSSLEIALLDFAQQNLSEEGKRKIAFAQELFEEPFDSLTKYSLSIHQIGNKKIAFLKGAPEILLKFCKNKEEEKRKILEIVENFGKKGLRVLGFAFKEGEEHEAIENLKEKKDFVFSGLLGIFDPPRTEVKDLLQFAQKAGIEVKIVTGDYKETAINLGKNLGIFVSPENVLEGKDLEAISEKELKEKLDKIKIFARVLPHHKRKIVDLLQEKGYVVAMTGDGVNDALALKEADIGIAVGEASEVAKEAADLILLDSNFKTIISACEEGRLVMSNIKKTVGYTLSNSFLEIAVISLAGLFGWNPPLSVPQILWLHLICDGPSDLMFTFKPKERDLMERKPIDIKREAILDRFLLSIILIVSFFVTILSLSLYWYFGIKQNNHLLGSTLVFATLGSVDLIYALSFKNLRRPIVKTENFFHNKFFFLGIFYGFFLLGLTIYSPFLNKILPTIPLTGPFLALVLAIGVFTTFFLEAVKLLNAALQK